MFKIAEPGNTWTHFVGAIFALSSIWLVWPAVERGWEMTFGVIFFIVGMFFMYLSSTLYHMVPAGKVKEILRRCDHISIYVMIACSYTPLVVGVIGGWLGWFYFGLQWACVLGGTVYKIFAFGKYPKLSLAIYLIMGWSVILIMPKVISCMHPLTVYLLLAEGVFYTAGTYFFQHDYKPNYHWIWHIFVLLGTMAHWSAVTSILLGFAN